MNTTVKVTIEVTVRDLPDEKAREHARWMAERHGLVVTGTSIARNADGGKPFVPKGGKPGSIVVRAGRSYQVWSDAPGKGEVWAVAVDRSPDHAALIRTSVDGRRGGWYLSYNADGSEWRKPVAA